MEVSETCSSIQMQTNLSFETVLSPFNIGNMQCIQKLLRYEILSHIMVDGLYFF